MLGIGTIGFVAGLVLSMLWPGARRLLVAFVGFFVLSGGDLSCFQTYILSTFLQQMPVCGLAKLIDHVLCDPLRGAIVLATEGGRQGDQRVPVCEALGERDRDLAINVRGC